MDLKRIFKNLLSSVLVYGVLLFLNLFVSNVILRTFQSEMNGLISSINQIFSYIAILEAGIGVATVNAFYKPIANNNAAEINAVYSTSVRYFRRATVGYVLCTIVAAIVWPLVVDTDINFFIIFAIILLQGISNALTFCFTSTLSAYMRAAGKNYVNTYFHIITTIATYLAKIIVCFSGLNYVFVLLLTLFINLLKCIAFNLYKRYHCKELGKYRKEIQMKLPQRNSLLIHEISGVIFAGTDVVLISIFCDLKTASVYTVYSMFVMACSGIISQVFTSLTYILGNAYSEGKMFHRVVDRFNALYIAAVFAIYSTLYLLLGPFISIYTNGITDINYTDALLPLLFVLIQLLSSCRIVNGEIIKIASHAKNTIIRSVVESTINLVLSIVLLQFIGMYGVLLGTIVALLYRANDITLYTNKHILNRKPWKEYGVYSLNFVAFFGIVALGHYFPIAADSYLALFGKALIVFPLVIVIYFVFNIPFIRSLLSDVLHRIKK